MAGGDDDPLRARDGQRIWLGEALIGQAMGTGGAASRSGLGLQFIAKFRIPALRSCGSCGRMGPLESM